jgi:hypothetical protein
MRLSRTFPAFSVAFGIAYVVSMDFHPKFTLFTYAPRLHDWFIGVPELAGRQGPGMYWYSWLATGLIAGLVAAGLAAVTPQNVRALVWAGWTWVTPILLCFVLAYLLRPWFGFH